MKKNIKNLVILGSVVASAALAVACCCPADEPVVEVPIEVKSTKTVKDVDWLNRIYTTEDGTFKVLHGEFERPIAEEIVETFSVSSVSYGDVDGEPGDEALVLTIYSGGGTGQLSDLTVFTLKDDEPEEIGRIPGGDRGDGGLEGVEVRGGAAIVKRAHSTDDDGACCPSLLKVETWKYKDGAFAIDPSKTKTRPFE